MMILENLLRKIGVIEVVEIEDLNLDREQLQRLEKLGELKDLKRFELGFFQRLEPLRQEV